MKKIVSLLMVITILFGLIACSRKSEKSFDDTFLADALASAALESSEAVSEVSLDGIEESKPSTQEQSMTTDDVTESAYVTVEETKTEYGLIQIPQINEANLDSKDVRIANAMFLSIRDQVLEEIEDCKRKTGDESNHKATDTICTTKYMHNDRLLSIMVKYTSLYPDSTATELYETVNIDVSTGKALDYREVIRAAGFKEDEVRAALRSYSDRCLFFEWEHDVYYSFAKEGEIPNGLGDPSYGWQEWLDEIVEGYDDPVQPSGKPWDALPLYPSVYAGETGLEVCISVPTAAGGGEYDTMVSIGHNDAETKLLNPYNPYGQLFGRDAMMTEAAYDAVLEVIGIDEDNSVHYSLSIDSMILMGLEEQSEPAYVLKTYTDEGDHIATAGWYAVGVFSGEIWEMDITSGEWISIMNGTGSLPEDIYTGAEMNQALAVIWSNPNEYYSWVADPCAEVDLIAFSSNMSHFTTDCEKFLLFAREDGTQVSFDSGKMVDDAFVSQYELYSLTMNKGDSVIVYADRPSGITNQAITVSVGSKVGIWVTDNIGAEDMPEFIYVTSSMK